MFVKFDSPETPIAIPSKTEWKHRATIKRMLSPNELALLSIDATDCSWITYI
jgi:hypothetical protein